MTEIEREARHTGGGRRIGLLAAGFCLALLLGAAGNASACPVCYGDAAGSVIDGAKLSVAFLGALVYGVLGGGVALVVAVRRRAAKDDPRHRLRLVPDETDDEG